MFAALLLSSGALTGRFGAKNVFIFGVSVFICASVACAFAPSITMLIAMRAIQGIGAAFLVPGSLTILRIYNDDERIRSGAIATWAAAGAMALVAGPVVGGWLVEHFGWKSIFLINFPLGLVCILVIALLAAAKPRQAQRINVPSQFFLALTLALFTFLMTEAGRYGWTSTISLSVLVATIFAFVVFQRLEQRSAQRVIDCEISTNPVIKSAVSGRIFM
ncbi:MFS transporter [Vibrio sp. CDRSL-10 TSBA]